MLINITTHTFINYILSQRTIIHNVLSFNANVSGEIVYNKWVIRR